MAGTNHHAKLHVFDGLQAEEMRIPATQHVQVASEAYGRLSVLLDGRALVTVDGEAKQHQAPAVIELAPGKEHRVYAVTDVAWLFVQPAAQSDSAEGGQ